MKRSSYRREILRTILRTKSRFFAIAAIVALGAGFLSGLTASSPDMRLRADRYYDRTSMMDLRILSTMGLTEDDIEAILAVEGVEEAEGSHYTDKEAVIGDASFLVRIHSLPDQVNQLVLEEGHMPGPGECVINPGKIKSGSIQLGETLSISENDDLSRKAYTIVGFVRDPQYLSFSFGSTNMGNGSLDYAGYVMEEEFTQDYYTEIRCLMQGGKEENAFSDTYLEKAETVKERVEGISREREEARYEDLAGQIEEELKEPRQTLEDKKQELADGQKKYAQALKDYEEARKEAEETFAEKHEEIARAEEELSEAEAQIAEGETELAEAGEELRQARLQLDEAQKALASQEEQLKQEGRKLEDAEEALKEGKEQLDQGAAELESNREKLEANRAELEGTKAQLDQAVQGLAQMEQALAEMDAQAETLQQQIEQAKAAAQEARAAGMDEEAQAYEQICTDLTQSYDRLIEQRDGLGQQYQTSSSRYQEGLRAYEEGRGALESAEAAFQRAEEEYERAVDAYAGSDAEYQAGLKQYQEALAQIEQAKEELAGKEAEYAKGLAAWNDSAAQLDQAKEEAEEGRKQLDSGKEELAQAEAEAEEEFTEAETELEKARTELADGEEALKEAEEELAEAEKEAYDKLSMPEWYILTREQNEGYVSYSNDADRMRSIATVFPWMFFFVAALVSLTSMTRMVEEERVLIGTYKALGFSKLKILNKYILYAVLASVLGSLAGAAVLMKVFPYVICKAYDTMYVLPERVPLPYYASYFLIAAGLSIVCTVGATLAAGYHTMAEVPAALMMPQAPKAGKRIFLEHVRPIWKRLPFTSKVTARNLFRYKKRLIMTVIGIGGCTALLVTGFGLHDSISGILEKQYGEIYRYGILCGLEEGTDPQDVRRAMEEELPDTAWHMQMTRQIELRSGKKTADVNLYVPEDTASMEDFVTLRSRVGGKKVPFEKDSVVITEKLSKKLEAAVGDTIEIKNEQGRYIPLTVTGICEHYVYDYVYISRGTLEQTVGDTWNPSELDLIQADEQEIEILKTKIPGVVTVSRVADVTRTFEKMIQSLNLVIGVLIISAGALAFIVLYNLTNINVMERQREIATIKVLGFFHNEVNAYIYRETMWLSLIGCALGLILGIFMHRFVITTVEVDVVMFSRTIHGMSFVWSAIMTGIFSVIVGIVMNRKLKQISMVDSLKSVD